MLPGFKALKLYKGDTFSLRLNISSNQEPYNLTDHTFVSQIKQKGKSDVVAEFDYLIEDPEGGVITLTLTPEEASKLNSTKRYEYDLQMNYDGTVSTIIYGPVIVVHDVSS